MYFKFFSPRRFGLIDVASVDEVHGALVKLVDDQVERFQRLWQGMDSTQELEILFI